MKRIATMGALLAAASLGGLQASQTARDNGFLSVSLTSGQRKLVTVPFVRPLAHEGSVTGTGSNSITETGAFTAGEFNEAAGDSKYELEVTSGRYIGLILPVSSNSADAVFLAGTLPTPIHPSTQFVIRKSWTPVGLFGSTTGDVTNHGLAAASAPTSSTQLEQLNGGAGISFGEKAFFRSSAGGWRSTTNASLDVGGLRLGNSFFVFQPGSLASANVKMAGEVRKTRTLFPAGGAAGNSLTLIGNPNPFATTLVKSGLRNSFGESSLSNSVTTANSPTAADEVRYWNPSAASVSNFFFRTGGGLINWVASSGGALNDNKAISAGEGFILKRNPAGGTYVSVNPTLE